jgi:hypothetical protein
MSELLKRILTFGLLGALLVAGAIYFYNEGATPTLAGEITEVRTLAMDEASSVAVVNFSGTNTSDRIVFIHQRELTITDEDGATHIGLPVQVTDVQNLFKYFPILGGMKDAPLLPRTEIEPGSELRGLVAARFDMPKHELDTRKSLLLKFYNDQNRSTELSETR